MLHGVQTTSDAIRQASRPAGAPHDEPRGLLVTTGIYGTAIEPMHWDSALRAIQGLFRASAVSLIERDLTTMRGHWLSTHDPETERDSSAAELAARAALARIASPIHASLFDGDARDLATWAEAITL